MPKRVGDYQSWLQTELRDPQLAAEYLTAALEDSPSVFLVALKDVSQSHQVANVARKAGVKRESLYKAFSEQGNPTFDTLHSVLNVFGVKMKFEPSSAPVRSRASDVKPDKRKKAKAAEGRSSSVRSHRRKA